MALEIALKWLGGILAISTLGFMLYSIGKGTQRKVGRISGNAGWLRSPFFYLAATVFFLGVSWLGWIPFPLNISPPARNVMLLTGALLYFPGLGLVLWGRLALGKDYFVSTGLGAQLFAGQQLVTTGPYAIVRHPMYVGLALAALGSLLVYATWTTVYFAASAPLLAFRARREEQALAAEFGEQWDEYCRHVPAFFPRLRKS